MEGRGVLHGLKWKGAFSRVGERKRRGREVLLPVPKMQKCVSPYFSQGTWQACMASSQPVLASFLCMHKNVLMDYHTIKHPMCPSSLSPVC